MAADGSIIIDTKIDDSGIPKQLGKMKTSLAQAAKTLALPVAIAAGAIAAVSKIVGHMGELNKIYMVQASAERALSQAAANNPYLTGESVNNLKRYASELQKVSNYGDEVTIGLMTQLAAAGRTESEIKSIIKASADLAASGTTTFDGAVKNLNKTYSGLSGELGEVIPELKTLTAEQMKNGDAVDLIAKKYDGMALSVVDKSTQMHNAMGDLKEQIGRGLSPVVDEVSGFFGTLAGKMAEALQAANDWRDAQKAEAEGTETNEQLLSRLNGELGDLNAKTDELKQKASTPFLGAFYKDALIKSQLLVQAKEKEIKKITDQMTAEEKQKALQLKTAQEEEEAAKKSKEKTDALIAAYADWEKAQARANKAAELGVSTQEEQWEDLQQAAKDYQEKLVDITLQYGELGRESQAALALAKGVTGGVDLSAGLSPSVTGIKMPMGIFDTLVNNAAERGDKAGKELTNSMAAAIDDTSIGVSDAMGAVMGNIGAVFTTTVAVVKKIFAGIKSVAKFDPAEMYAGFEDILTGLTEFFAKVGSIPSYIEAGKKVLFEFMRGMLENKETNMETFRNVLTYMIESAKEVLPAVIEFAFIMMTDMATAIIDQLPLMYETAIEIIKALTFGILEALPELLSAAIEVLPQMMTYIVSTLPAFIAGIVGMVPDILAALLVAYIQNIPTIWSAVTQNLITLILLLPTALLASMLLMMAEMMLNLMSPSEDAGTAMVDAMGKGFANSWSTFGDGIAALFGTLWEKLKEIVSGFGDFGKAMVDGLINGLTNNWQTLKDFVKKVFNSIIDGFKDLFGIHSPSTVFAGFGGMIMEGLKNGITGAKIWDGIKSTFTTIIDNIKKLFSAETWTNIGDKIKGGITGANKWDGIKSTFTTIIDNIKSLFSAVNLASVGDGIKNAIISGVSSAISSVSNVITAVSAGVSSLASTVVDWFKGLFNAEGTNNFRGGTAIINEEGAEMVTLPSGSKVMTASATAQMQDRAISQLLSGMKMPSFATAGSGGNKSITIENKINSPIMVDGSVFGRLVYETIDKAVV